MASADGQEHALITAGQATWLANPNKEGLIDRLIMWNLAQQHHGLCGARHLAKIGKMKSHFQVRSTDIYMQV